jgi:hypothetical protein
MTKTEILDMLRKLKQSVKARIDTNDPDEFLSAVLSVCRLHRRILDGCRADDQDTLSLADGFVKNTLKMLEAHGTKT